MGTVDALGRFGDLVDDAPALVHQAAEAGQERCARRCSNTSRYPVKLLTSRGAVYTAFYMMWPKPWWSLKTGLLLERELRRELSSSHVLAGLPLRAVARRIDQDQVMYEIVDGSGRLALVHLTWQGETDPNRPRTMIFVSLHEAQACLAAGRYLSTQDDSEAC